MTNVKKISIGISAAIIVALTSCSHNEIFDKESSSQNFIEFATLNDKVHSRAANDSSSNYTVYAENYTPTADWLINGAELNGKTNAPANPIPWLENKTYSFIAYAPVATAAAAGDEGLHANVTAPSTVAGNIALTYTVPAKADVDFTVAAPITNKASSDRPTISFQFKHMLSKVVINIRVDPNLPTVVGSEYKFSHGAPTFAVNKKTSQAFDYSVGTSAYSLTATAATDDATSYNGVATTGEVDTHTIGTFYIMPQPGNGCNITIPNLVLKQGSVVVKTTPSYSIDFDPNTIETDAGAFVSGKQYNLTITVKGDYIEFESSVDPAWTNVDTPL